MEGKGGGKVEGALEEMEKIWIKEKSVNEGKLRP